MKNDHPAVSPITISLVWNNLVSIAEEMGSTLRRTAFSEAVREAGRSSQGFKIANSTAELLCAALVRKFNPLIEPTISTPGVA